MDESDLIDLRKKLIKAYVDLKKTYSNPSLQVSRKTFLKFCPFKRKHIDEAFGNYTDFIEIADAEFLESLPSSEKALLSERLKKFDEDATKEDCVEDLRGVQKINEFKFITRTFYRIHGKYSDSTWNRFFGTFHEFRRAANLELSRHQHQIEKNIARHASLDVIRDFHRHEVLPYLNKYEIKLSNGRYKTILVGSDFHDIECDEFMLEVFIDTARRMQPDIICLNGDVFDLYDSSRFDKDIRQLKITERFDFVKKKIFKPLRDVCPDSQIDFILGNHEWRILILLSAKTPNLRVILSDVMGLTLADIFGVDEYKINLICKLDLATFSLSDRNNEFKKNYRVYYDCFVVGHFKDVGFGMSGTSGHCHRPSTEIFTNLPMGKCFWVETGCMCHTDAEYVQHRDKWTQSFLIAHVDTFKKSVNPEHVIVTCDNVVIHGIRYERRLDKLL